MESRTGLNEILKKREEHSERPWQPPQEPAGPGGPLERANARNFVLSVPIPLIPGRGPAPIHDQ
jgi:hypothetical protein